MSSTSYTQLNLNNNNFTIEFWLYIQQNQTASIITYLPTYSNFSTKLVSNILYCYLGSTIMIAGKTSLQINQWYHIAVVRSNTTAISTFSIFINGSLDNYSTAAQTTSLNIANVPSGINVYPPAAMTANQTTITGQSYGNGEYVASASSFVNIPTIPQIDPPYLAFNKAGGTDNNIWGASAAVYNSSSPYNYIGTVQTITNTTINSANITISPGLVNNWAMNSGTIVIISGTSFGGLIPGTYVVDQLISNTVVSLYGFVATSTVSGGSMTLSTAQSPTFTTIINNTPIYGEYLDILLPNSIVLTSYSIQSRYDTNYIQSPGTWYLVGTNNGGVTWTQLDTRTSFVFTSANQIQTFSITNALAFKEYRIVITNTSGASSGYLSIAEMYLYGIQYTNVQQGINNNDVVYQIGNFTGFIDEVRVTNGVARYTGNFQIPLAPFASAQITDYTTTQTDNIYTYTTLLLPLNGNIIDYSIYSNTISVAGVTPAVIYSNNTKFAGKSFSFNGTTILKTSANKTVMFGTDPFTIEFWMNPSATQPTVARIMGNATTSSYGPYTWAITYTSGVIGLIIGTTQIFTGTIIIPTSIWTHVAIVRYGGIFNLYVNGVLNTLSTVATAATGGTKTGPLLIGNTYYNVHTFTSNGIFTLTGNTIVADILIVGGGGGGAGGYPVTGGGGGAGGYQYYTSYSLTPGTYSITVGNGGSGGTNLNGINGGQSIFQGIYPSYGGGGGYGTISAGSGGGSGGGGGSVCGSNLYGTQGNLGGIGGGVNSSSVGGGGGGAASIGINGASGGTGGTGLLNNITGVPLYYAGGGGGGVFYGTGTAPPGGLGGLGGGGTGCQYVNSGTAFYGIANTGGGGGGAGGNNGVVNSSTGGSGGSGVVIVRYPIAYTSSYALDSISSGTANVLFSIQRVKTAYTGAIIQLSLSSTLSNPQNFYYVNGQLNTLITGAGQSYAAWSSNATFAYISTWYDQSGNGKNATSTSPYAPKFNIGGFVDFTGTSIYMSLPIGTLPTSLVPSTVCWKSGTISGSGERGILCNGTAGTAGNFQAFGVNLSVQPFISYSNAGYASALSMTYGGTVSIVSNNTISSGGSQTINGYFNGSAWATSSTSFTSTFTASGVADILGSSRNNTGSQGAPTTNNFNGQLYWLSVYNGALNTTDRNTVENQYTPTTPLIINQFSSLDGADLTPSLTSYIAVGGDGVGLSASTSGYYSGLLSQVRITRYYPRYLSAFTVPSAVYPQIDTIQSATSLNYYYGAQLIVANWITRVSQIGGTVSSLYAQYHTNFVATLLNQNIWQKIYRLNTFSGDQLASALVPLKITPGYGTEVDIPSVYDTYTKLLLHFDGPNGSTTFTDSSVYANTGNISVGASGSAANNAAIQYAPNNLFSKFGSGCLGSKNAQAGTQAGTFYIQTNSASQYTFGTQNFTIEFWLLYYPTQFNSNGRLASNYITGTFGANNWVIIPPTASVGCQLSISNVTGNIVCPASTTTTGWNDTTAWHHYAFVRSGTSFYGYTDGLAGTLVTSSASLDTGTTNLITIGGNLADNSGNGAFTNCWIDEFRISIGIARYSGTFAPSNSPFTTALPSITYNSTGSSSGVLGDAALSYIDTKLNLNTLTATGRDLHMGLWIFSTSATGFPMGVYSGSTPAAPTTRSYIPYATPGTTNFWGSPFTYSSQTSAGLYLVTNDTYLPITATSNISGLQSSTASFYVNGTQIALTNTQNYSQPSDWTVTILATNGSTNGLNSDTQLVSNFSNSRVGIYTIGAHLLPQDQITYYRAMVQLNASMSRT